ncbi:MAG: helix-turn-helix transcriptional regulator [Spirosomaceae bacterium]|nr:helix-turn-helix transcriptional regulator [Spirosomataceae bacterium]
MSIVSQNIKYLRRTNGLTQEQFASRIGIKRSLVGAYEEARANPPLDKLKIIANTFKITVDALIKHDIRKLRETPDMAFEFEKEKSAVPIRDVAADFLNKIQPTLEAPRPRPSIFEDSRPESRVESTGTFNRPEIAVVNNNRYQQTEVTSPKVGMAKPNEFVIISLHQQVPYINNIDNKSFVERLETYRLPQISGNFLRGFELGNDFPIRSSVVIGQRFSNINNVVDGTAYILVTKSSGIIYRRVYNQLKIKNKLLLSSDIHNILSQEILENDILELWEVVGYYSTILPKPNPSLEKIERYINDAAKEVEKLKNSVN